MNSRRPCNVSQDAMGQGAPRLISASAGASCVSISSQVRFAPAHRVGDALEALGLEVEVDVEMNAHVRADRFADGAPAARSRRAVSRLSQFSSGQPGVRPKPGT